MQNSGIDIQSLIDLLSSVSKFSVNIQSTAKKLSQTTPETLGPIMSYLCHMLTLPPQNKKVQTSILALRLIKQSFLLGTYSFYIQVCSYVVPILFQYFYKDPVNQTKFESLDQYLSRQRCKDLLKEKWYVQSQLNLANTMRVGNGEILTEGQIASCNNYLELIFEFIKWCSLIIQKHPSSVSTFRVSDNLDKLNFSSIFRVIAREDNGLFKIYPPPPRFPEFKFFKYQSKEKFSKNIFSDSQKYFDKISTYCHSLTFEYLETRSAKALRKLHEMIYFTADSFIISSIIEAVSTKIEEQQKTSGIPTFKDTDADKIGEYVNRAAQIGRIKGYISQSAAYSAINENDYDSDEIEYQVKLAYKIVPLCLPEVFQKQSPSIIYYQGFSKIFNSVSNLQEELQDNSLYLRQIYQQLINALSKLSDFPSNSLGPTITKNQLKQPKKNNLNILKTTNLEKNKNLINLYSQSLSQILDSIENYSKNIKSKFMKPIPIPQEMPNHSQEEYLPLQNKKLMEKYGAANSDSIYQPNSPEQYIYDQASSNTGNKISEYDGNGRKHIFQIDSIVSHDSSVGGTSLSSRAKRKVELKRLATLGREKESLINSPDSKQMSSMTEPKQHFFKKVSPKEFIYTDPSNSFGQSDGVFKKNPLVETIKSNQSIQSSLTDRIKRRKAQIEMVRSVSKQKLKQVQQHNFPRQTNQVKQREQLEMKMKESQKQKASFVSFFNKNIQQQSRRLESPKKLMKQSQFRAAQRVSTMRIKNVDQVQSQFKSPPIQHKEKKKESIKILEFDQLQHEQVRQRGWKLNSKEKVMKKIEMKQLNKKTKIEHNPPNIMIEPTLCKPPFGFRKQNIEDKEEDKSQFVSEQSSQSSLLNPSKDSVSISLVNVSQAKNTKAQNFADILQVNPTNHKKSGQEVKVIKNGGITGYMIPAASYKSREKKLIHQMQLYQQYHDLYNQKIGEKEGQIEKLNQKLKREKDELEAYAKHLNRAYETAYENPDSLMIMSKDSDDEVMFPEDKVRNLKKLQINFINLKKKLFKQILYGKALLIQNEYIQVGYNNREKECEVNLYLQFKIACVDVWINLQNIDNTGYSLIQNDSVIHVNSVPAGKRLKLNYYFGYKFAQQLNFIKLVIKAKQFKATDEMKWGCSLPFCLYNNFFSLIKVNEKNFSPRFITKWETANEELRQNRAEFMSSLFKEGKWVNENEYFMGFLFKGEQIRLKIIVSGKNFAIETEINKFVDVIATVGSLLAKNL